MLAAPVKSQAGIEHREQVLAPVRVQVQVQARVLVPRQHLLAGTMAKATMIVTATLERNQHKTRGQRERERARENTTNSRLLW